MAALEKGRKPLRLVLGGQPQDPGATTPRFLASRLRRRDLARSAEELLTLAPSAMSCRYWLIDPFPTLRAVASGAALTESRVRLLRLAADALDAQVRSDDLAGRRVISALRSDLSDKALR